MSDDLKPFPYTEYKTRRNSSSSKGQSTAIVSPAAIAGPMVPSPIASVVPTPVPSLVYSPYSTPAPGSPAHGSPSPGSPAPGSPAPPGSPTLPPAAPSPPASTISHSPSVALLSSPSSPSSSSSTTTRGILGPSTTTSRSSPSSTHRHHGESRHAHRPRSRRPHRRDSGTCMSRRRRRHSGGGNGNGGGGYRRSRLAYDPNARRRSESIQEAVERGRPVLYGVTRDQKVVAMQGNGRVRVTDEKVGCGGCVIL